MFEGLGKFKTILCDPPYEERGGGKIKRGADRHYDLMKTADIASMPVKSLIHEEGCHLWLWVTNNFLKDGIAVMEAWGFRYVTNRAWVKQKIGLGQYIRGQHELLLFGVAGKLPYKIEQGKRQQVSSVIFENATIHSAKPLSVYKDIETVSYAPYLELFARRPSDEAWTRWGNQANKEQNNTLFKE